MRRGAQGSTSCGLRSAAGFTLVELLVVIAIITVLLSVLLPAITAATNHAKTTQCANNVKQLCTALLIYAQSYDNQFPPNYTKPSPGKTWADKDVIGTYLPQATVSATYGVGGGVFICPMDTGNAQRSYAMNIWASCQVDSTVVAAPARGQLWTRSYQKASNLILITECWSSKGSEPAGWFAPANLGWAGTTPGPRFGVGGGLAPPLNVGRFGLVTSELPFVRHRTGKGLAVVAPVGRVNIGYADGHVATRSEGELGNSQTGLSTLDSIWSPMDADLNN